VSQYGFYFDQSRCINCHACSVACKDWNDLEPGPVKWLRRFEWETGSFPQVRQNYLFAPCFHCENAVCIEACDHGAIFKEDSFGAVLVDQALCAGDRNCYKVCPYGAPQFAGDAPGTKMQKCTMCVERLAQGQLPICVESCPLRALDFGPLDKLAAKYGDLRRLTGMPNPEGIKPAVIFKPAAPKKNLVPYNQEKAIYLLSQRGELPPYLESPEELTILEPGMIGHDRLILKAENSRELIYNTKSDEA